MRAATDDPIIRYARERMRRAAIDCENARDPMRWAMKELEKHPDYKRAALARKAGRGAAAFTLAYWLHDCCSGAFNDAPLHEAADWLREDAANVERSLRRFIQTEERERLAAKQKRAA